MQNDDINFILARTLLVQFKTQPVHFLFWPVN